jgi:succinate dehydrogenase hydrophobic anchor subunit
MEVMDAVLTLIKSAPHLAIWVLLILYGFKLFVVGSIYATIRYVIDRIATSIERWRQTPTTTTTSLVLSRHGAIGDQVVLMETSTQQLVDFLKSLRRNGLNYVHPSDLDRVTTALREYNERNAA